MSNFQCSSTVACMAWERLHASLPHHHCLEIIVFDMIKQWIYAVSLQEKQHQLSQGKKLPVQTLLSSPGEDTTAVANVNDSVIVFSSNSAKAAPAPVSHHILVQVTARHLELMS